jgi:acetyl-CoA synthetase
VTVNEMYGQTEINYIVGNCAAVTPPKPGAMGRGYPGHQLGVLDDEGNPVAPGEMGEVCVRRSCNGDHGPGVHARLLEQPAGHGGKILRRRHR